MKKHLQYFVCVFLIIFSCSAKLRAQSADITANKSVGCAPEVISFQVTNSPPAKGYIWIINKDTISGTVKQDYLFSSSGQYDITVIIAKTDGSFETITKNNLVRLGKSNDNITLQVSRKVLCNGADTATFTAFATGVKHWDWIIDGTNHLDAGNKVIHKFLTPGVKTVIIRTEDSSGCFALKTFTAAVTIATPPVVNFKTDIASGCAPLFVTLSSDIQTGSSAINSYNWILNGSNTASSSSPGPIKIHYDTAGSFDVTLTITTKDGCIYTSFKKDFISAGLIGQPILVASQKTGCPGTIITFLNKTVKGLNSTFTWSFPGGNVQPGSNDSVQFVQYPTGGNFDVSLTGTSNGCTKTTNYPALIQIDKISAAFSANKLCNCSVPDTITFSRIAGLSPGTGLNYKWTFFDTNGINILGTSSDSNPVFIYKKFGSYDVELKVNLTGGCSDSAINKNMLVFKPLDTATLLLTKAIGCTGKSVSLSLQAPNQCQSTDYIYEWTFYEKNTKNVIKVLKDKSPQIIYNDTGSYDVSLKITTLSGCVAEKVFKKAIVILIPKVLYKVDTLSTCVGGSVVLTQLTTPVGPDYTYNWELTNLSDTTIKITGTGATFTPVFAKAGQYRVTFSVALAGGCLFTSSQVSTVSVNGITGDFTAITKKGCLPFKTTLSAKIIQNIHFGNTNDSVQYTWTANPAGTVAFSDIHVVSPEITITQAGSYRINLSITNSSGCDIYIGKDSFITAGVIAGMNVPAQVCFGDTVTAVSMSSTNASVYNWSSKPGVVIIPSSSGSSAKMVFPGKGVFNIRLIVSSADGCKDTAIQSVEVKQVKAVFSSKDTFNTCAPAYASFTVERNGADSFYWSFGDGETLVTPDTSIAHVYKINSGDRNSGFDVTMVAKNNMGCSDRLVRKKYINVTGPVPAFTMSNLQGCGKLQVSFTNKSLYADRLFLDYGDFSPVDSLGFGPHTYTITDPNAEYAVFKPRLLAKDVSGCSAFAPVTDSIVVYRRPIAGFSYSTTAGCYPYPVQFKDTSHFATKWAWDFDNDGVTDDSTQNPSVVLKPGIYNVKLTVENRFGCSDSMVINQGITIYPNVTGKLKASTDTACLGSLAVFKVSVDSPELVASYRWMVDSIQLDTLKAKGNIANHRFYTAGLHSVSVIITTLSGCDVKVNLDHQVVVPDTTQKQGPVINFITVENDSSIHISWQASKAVFYGKYDLYRKGPNGLNLIYTSYTRSDTGYYDKMNLDVNRNNYTYYIRETDKCGLSSMPTASHTSILLKVSTPGPNKLQLNWTPYHGWASVSKYQVYRKGPNGFVLLVTLGGQDSTYLDEDVCDNMYTYRIVATDDTGVLTSLSNSSGARPLYALNQNGENVTYATVTDDDKVKIAWTNTDPRSVKYVIDRYTISSGGWTNDIARSTINEWTDDKTSVNSETYTYRVHILDKCGYISPAGNVGRSILLKTQLKNDKIFLSWTRYIDWPQGIENYRIEIQQDNGSWSLLGFTLPADTAFTDSEIHKEIKGKYIYRVIAIQSGGSGIISISNKAEGILPSRVFIPNVFTPTSDGLNEVFRPVGSFLAGKDAGGIYLFTIYNRWGERVFQTDNPETGWDGSFEGKPVQEGVYVYYFNAVGLDRQTFYLKGNVTLLR